MGSSWVSVEDVQRELPNERNIGRLEVCNDCTFFHVGGHGAEGLCKANAPTTTGLGSFPTVSEADSGCGQFLFNAVDAYCGQCDCLDECNIMNEKEHSCMHFIRADIYTRDGIKPGMHERK